MKVCLVILFVSFLSVSAHAQRKGLHPDFLGMQYAGSIGYLSGSVGWNLIQNKTRFSFHGGYVPRYFGGPLNIMSAKFAAVPKVYHLSETTTINPFDLGLMVSYHFGDDFQTRWPDQRYPAGYYWWQTSFRFHIFLQSSVTFKLRDHTVFKYFTPYIEVNSNELYLVSLFQNLHGMRASDVLKLGVGARLSF
jgi:hypothetical protein